MSEFVTESDVDSGYEGMTGGEVLLVVPAAPEYLRLVRLTAAGLASRMGFTFDEVEDLRIAVDELCHLLLMAENPTDAAASGGGRTIELRYRSETDLIKIDGATAHEGEIPEPGELSLQILTALVDNVALDQEDGRIAFHLTKQREPV
jgi:serine/threonine-protein kinase RsbW